MQCGVNKIFLAIQYANVIIKRTIVYTFEINGYLGMYSMHVMHSRSGADINEMAVDT